MNRADTLVKPTKASCADGECPGSTNKQDIMTAPEIITTTSGSPWICLHILNEDRSFRSCAGGILSRQTYKRRGNDETKR